MVEEEASASEVTVADQTVATAAKNGETLDGQGSVEATIELAVQGGTESTCNDGKKAESVAGVPDEEREKTLQFAEELAERGSKAFKENDYAEAADCFSRALEIRVAHHGELAVECLNAYYQYGRALLYKAQEEADPLGKMPKKEGESQQESIKDGSVKTAMNGGSSTVSVSSKAEQDGTSMLHEGTTDDGSSEKVHDEDNDDEDQAEADGEDSDLDLAWEMLDIARAIADKLTADTMEKVDILSALAEVALEREDIDSSLSDYQKALSILELLVESDSRLIAELNFRLCLCLEIGSKPQEALPYCQKALSVCKARLERLSNEVESSLGSATSSAVSEIDEGIERSSNLSYTDKSVADKEAEIKTLSGLAEELEKKLEDLKQHAQNPKSILAEFLAMASSKSKANTDKGSSSTGPNRDSESPSLCAAQTNGASSVTNLGVVGRGVKRVVMNSSSADPNPNKKPAVEKSDKGDGN